MHLSIYQLDAFTDSLFGGNSAAVIPLDHWLDDALMLQIAMENNLSETAFFVPLSDGRYHIRWFSPVKEIAFCGHATLATAKVLFDSMAQTTQITFFAQAVGDLTVIRNGELIEMRFPKREAQSIEQTPQALINGLSIQPQKILRNEQAYFAIYENVDDIFNVEPDCPQLATLAPYDVVVTAKSNDDQYDFVSRYFWPSSGGVEDPVTGSIHTGLAPYWAMQLNKTTLKARQASSRGGDLFCEVVADNVIIAGQAVHYLTGQITIPNAS